MIPESAFHQILGDVNGVSIEEMITLFNIAVQYQLKANEAYIRDGESSKKLAFTEKGIIRTYAVKDNGEKLLYYCAGKASSLLLMILLF